MIRLYHHLMRAYLDWRIDRYEALRFDRTSMKRWHRNNTNITRRNHHKELSK